jgi:predicted AAA+ superfamily ATPase
MSKSLPTGFVRSEAAVLAARLAEPRRFLQVVAGPRQTGKTTLVRQVLEDFGERARYASADEPTLRDRAWLATQWEMARETARRLGGTGAILALDEIQKVPGWSETVKRMWDEDTVARRRVRVVLLGSAPLLLQTGLSESLAGRFEVLPIPHWSFSEMREAFGFTIEQYIYFGGYPGSAPLISDPARWARYIRDSLIETTIARDVLLLSRVDKPALLRQLFELGCRYSGQILSYTKMLGQLHDAGNTTTLSHYLDLLAGAGMMAGLRKYSGSVVRQRGSIPKLQVFNNALVSAQSGLTPKEARSDPDFWGRLVESAVGAHLSNAAITGECELFYWRERNREVDFVVRHGRQVLAIEVKSGRRREALPGLTSFTDQHRPSRSLLVGADGIAIEAFLSRPISGWIGQ